MVEFPRMMCTQHPDSTLRVPAHMEIQEALMAFTAYGCDEVMVDYEGKLTPYSQPREVVAQALERGIALGENRFVTVRLPNPQLESADRLVLALVAALSANALSASRAGTQAVRWLVLPMLSGVDALKEVHQLALKLSGAIGEDGVQAPLLVPLLESVESLSRVGEYLRVLVSIQGGDGGLRVFLGASDSAVSSGHIASSLAVRYALGEVSRESDKLGVEVAPILGMGRPPFRGGVNEPSLASREASQYAGYWTVTVQSAIRYDASSQEYRQFASAVAAQRGAEAESVDARALEVVKQAEEYYRKTLVKVSQAILAVVGNVPQTRDRLVWTEYARRVEVGGAVLKLPRAIPFTAACYSLGLPPTFLDAPFILQASGRGLLGKLLELLPNLPLEWEYDSQFLVSSSVRRFLGGELLEVVRKAMALLGVEECVDSAYAHLVNPGFTELGVLAAARWRGFLG
ncbi:MAG: phosphoenolpyruvate carboxylase [Thermofilum sp.]